MAQRTRKFIGTLLLLASIVVWSVAGTWLYMALLGNAPWWALILYFAVAGGGWFFPAAWIIRWMSRP